jgi:general secretion pathway protein I
MDYILKPYTLKYLNSITKKTDGFTLIEVLVALAVLTITLTSIYRLHSQTMMMSSRARFYTLAPALAQSRLADMDRNGIKEAADGTGDFGQAYPGYGWASRIEEMPSELLQDKPYHLVQIDITVTRDDQDSYNLRTYRFYAE